MAEVVIIKPIVDVEKCTLCETCLPFCPDSCITAGDDGHVVVDYSDCKGCSMCAAVCAEEAIEMVMMFEEGKS
jgi:pyruvate ferredoxin oxidoreductase delta subunit